MAMAFTKLEESGDVGLAAVLDHTGSEMPVYVLYGGRLIDKRYCPAPAAAHAASDLPAPAIQSFESYASPIDDSTISSHRQRDTRPAQLWQLRPQRHPRRVQESTRWPDENTNERTAAEP